MNSIPLQQFHTILIILTVLLTISICYAGIFFIKRVKRKKEQKSGGILLYGGVLGGMFWGSHILISLSTGLPLSSDFFGWYISLTFLLCFAASYCAMWVSRFEVKSNSVFLMASLFLAFSILAADVAGFSVLFHEYLSVNLPLSLLTVGLAISMAVPLLRFLLLLARENGGMTREWEWTGTIATGLALSALPYTILVSLLDYTAGGGWILFPFILALFANLILLLIPDFLGYQYQVRSAESFRSLFRHNPNAIFSADKKGRILEVNEEAERLTGLPEEALRQMDVFYFLGGEAEEKVRDYFQNILAGNVEHLFTKVGGQDGEERDVKITAVRTIVQGRIIGVFGVVEDITEQLESRKTIEHLAYHDELTGLPNRRKLKKITDGLRKEEEPFAFLMMDFDHFKRVNDTYGHSFGDDLLVQVGRAIETIAEEYGAHAIRLGGDEFLVVCGITDASQIAEEIREHFSFSMEIRGEEIRLTSSIGWTDTRDTEDPVTLLKYADMTMYLSKEKGGNCITRYDRQLFMEKESVTRTGND